MKDFIDFIAPIEFIGDSGSGPAPSGFVLFKDDDASILLKDDGTSQLTKD